MEEICNDEVEQVSGGSAYWDQRNLQDFLNRFFQERGGNPFPTPRPGPEFG